MKIYQIIQERNRFEQMMMPGASAEDIASARTKRRFGRDVPGTEAARQKMHPRGEQRGGPGRKGVNTSGRNWADPLAKREPKGNEPVTPAEAGPRKRETRRIEHLKAKVNLPEPKAKKPTKPKAIKPTKTKKSKPKKSETGKKVMENNQFNKEEFTKLLIESAAAYENKYRIEERSKGYKKGTLRRAVIDALRGGADPEAVKKEGPAGETVRSKGAQFRGKGAAKGFAEKMKKQKKSHLPPKDEKLMRQGLKMEETRQDEVRKYFDPNQRRTERRLKGQAMKAKADNPKALQDLGKAAKVATAKAKFRKEQIKKNQMDDSKYPFK